MLGHFPAYDDYGSLFGLAFYLVKNLPIVAGLLTIIDFYFIYNLLKIFKIFPFNRKRR